MTDTGTDEIMVTDSEQFQLKGFAKLPGIFSAEEAQEMRAEVERYLDKVAPDLPEAAVISLPDNVPGIEEAPSRVVFMSRMDLYDPFFEKLRNDPRLAEKARQLLGCEVEAQHVQFLDIIPGVSRPTPPHQDAPIFAIEPSHAVTFWMPLCEVDETNGCMHYVPGSQWQESLAHNETGPRTLTDAGDSLQSGVGVPASPGDVVAHHCYTIHYSAENTSGKNRWALALHFYPVGVQRFREEEWVQRRAG
jgi:phytanoyl-CoA hydroxylase